MKMHGALSKTMVTSLKDEAGYWYMEEVQPSPLHYGESRETDNVGYGAVDDGGFHAFTSNIGICSFI